MSANNAYGRNKTEEKKKVRMFVEDNEDAKDKELK